MSFSRVLFILLATYASGAFAQLERPRVYVNMPPLVREDVPSVATPISLNGEVILKSGTLAGEYTDTDGDGVMDVDDQCADTPPKRVVDRCGCETGGGPCCIDTDNDGIVDCKDQCASTPIQFAVDSFGCPVFTNKPVIIRLKVQFKFNRHEIRPGYFKHLEEIRDFLAATPSVRLELNAHTDSIGSDAFNRNLSILRGFSVRRFLLMDGRIDPERILVNGYGESRPIATNSIEAGRALNRRVEASITQDRRVPLKRK